jgi:hypothetical protein
MATVATRRRADLLLVAEPGEQREQEREREEVAAPCSSFEDVTSAIRPRRTVAVGGQKRERPQKATGMERRIALGVTALGFCLLVGLASAHTSHARSASSVPGYGAAARDVASFSPAPGHQAGSGASLAPVTNPPAPVATLSPATSPTPQAGGDGFSLDPKQWVIDALGAAFSWIFSSLSAGFTDLLKQALNLDILSR